MGEGIEIKNIVVWSNMCQDSKDSEYCHIIMKSKTTSWTGEKLDSVLSPNSCSRYCRFGNVCENLIFASSMLRDSRFLLMNLFKP